MKYAPTGVDEQAGLLLMNDEGQMATITYTDSSETEVIKSSEHTDALAYELEDMEKAIGGDRECMHLEYTKDVRDMMTGLRKSGNKRYV